MRHTLSILVSLLALSTAAHADEIAAQPAATGISQSDYDAIVEQAGQTERFQIWNSASLESRVNFFVAKTKAVAAKQKTIASKKVAKKVATPVAKRKGKVVVSSKYGKKHKRVYRDDSYDNDDDGGSYSSSSDSSWRGSSESSEPSRPSMVVLSNGQVGTRSGNTIVYNNGVVGTETGNTEVRSDGVIGTRTGNITVYSNGTVSTN